MLQNVPTNMSANVIIDDNVADFAEQLSQRPQRRRWRKHILYAMFSQPLI